MDKYELRRLRLEKIKSDFCDGKIATLADKIGRSASYVSRMLYPAGKEGKKNIGEDMVDVIAQTFGVDLDSDGIASPSNIKARHPDDPMGDDVVYVPESHIEFAAGNGRTAMYELTEDEEPATYRLSWFQKNGINPNRVRRFRVSGDSMEPLLYSGDTILVNTDEKNVIDGKLYAIRYIDELRVKYVRRLLDNTLILHSVNPQYEDEKVTPELASEHISIIGRVRDKSGTGGL